MKSRVEPRCPCTADDKLASLIGGSGRLARVALPLDVTGRDDRITGDLGESASQLLAAEMRAFGRKIAATGPNPHWFSDAMTGRQRCC